MAIQRDDTAFEAVSGLIETDHRVQERLFGALVESLRKRRRVGLCRGLLRDLEEHARSHFQTEAALMRDHGYPRAAEHIRQHEVLLAELSEARAGSLSGPVTLTVEEVEAIRARFERHVAELDRALEAFLGHRAANPDATVPATVPATEPAAAPAATPPLAASEPEEPAS